MQWDSSLLLIGPREERADSTRQWETISPPFQKLATFDRCGQPDAERVRLVTFASRFLLSLTDF